MKKFIIFTLFTILVFSTAQQAYAYALLGGKQKTNNIKYYPLDFNGTYEKIGKPFNDALADWNATKTKISFTYNTNGLSGNQITVKAKDYGNVPWSGRCTNYRDWIVAGDYTDSTVEGNLWYLNKSTYNTDDVKGVWAHELGHALGLEHVSGKDKLMYENDGRTVYKPTSDEVNGINYLYK